MADPFLDAIGVKDEAAPTGNAMPTDPYDLAVRLTMLEEKSPTARKWIAGVMANRAKAAKGDLMGSLTAPGAYEPYATRQAEIAAIDPNSDAYKATAAAVLPILKGDTADPSGGAMHFYAPKAQGDLGRSPPDFEDGKGIDVGDTRFFGGSSKAPDTFLDSIGADADKAESEAAHADPANFTKMVKYKELAPADQAVYRTLLKAGILDPNAQQGSRNFPFFNTDPKQVPPGAYYAEKGVLKRAPGGIDDEGGAAKAGEGGLMGVGDVATTVMSAIPGHEDSDVYNSLKAHQLLYGARLGGDPVAGAGRFTGQVAASAPALAAGEAAATAGLTRAGTPAVADFIAGRGGLAMKKGLERLLVRDASLSTAGAAGGAGAAGLSSSANEGTVPEQMAAGAEGGAVLGPLAPLAQKGGATLANKVIGSAKGISTEVANLADLAIKKYGIPLRTTQIKGVGDRAAAVHDSEMISRGGTGYAENNAAQRQAFTRAVAKTFGADADKLTPDVMQTAKTDLGAKFDAVAQNTTIDGNGLAASLKKVLDEATQVLPDSDVTPLKKQVANITSAIKDGKLAGESYQALTRKGSPLDRAMESGNPNIRAYAQDLRSALDDALQASASKEDVALLRETRRQYKNLMTIKNLAAKANVEGEISPALLNGAVNTSFKNRAFQGAGDLGELAQIGQTFLKEPPNSGTAPRLRDMVQAAALGGGGMADAAIAMHDPVLAAKLLGGAALAGGARYASNRITGAMGRSPAAVRKLIANAPNPVPTPLRNKVIGSGGKVGQAIIGATAAQRVQ